MTMAGRNRTPQILRLGYGPANGSDISDSGDIARVCNQHFVSVGRRLAEKIPFTDESPTAHIKVANVKFQFSIIAVSQTVKVN